MSVIKEFNQITDNTNTLFSNVLEPSFGSDTEQILINTRIARSYILSAIKQFIDSEKQCNIREWYGVPNMDYTTYAGFNYSIKELKTDEFIVPFEQNIAAMCAKMRFAKLPVSIDPFDFSEISQSNFDERLATCFNTTDTNIIKIFINDAVSKLSNLKNGDSATQEQIANYLLSKNIELSGFNTEELWSLPLKLLAEENWMRSAFALVINDYEIYDSATSDFVLELGEKFYDNGYFDEVIIKINYLYWFDDFKKITQFVKEHFHSTLVSFRLDTIMPISSNRYYSESVAMLYGDTMRQNTEEEELLMYQTRYNVLISEILKNNQSYGFELSGGYFGKEGEPPSVFSDDITYSRFRELTCELLEANCFVNPGEGVMKKFDNASKKLFVCLKKPCD